jgi:hypothetical protein
MNILGKILVFLNLLFALAVAGFLLVDFKTRLDWKNKFDDLKREYDASEADFKTVGQTNSLTKEKIRNLEKEITDVKKNHADAVTRAEKDVQREKEKTIEALEIAKLSDLNRKKAETHVATLNLEKIELAKKLTKSEDVILALEEKMSKSAGEVQQAKNDRDVLLNRLALLEEQLKKANLDIAYSKVSKEEGVKIKDKNSPNPPPFYIKGKVLKVDGEDSTLVILSLGKDHGLEVGQTLEVYRKIPQAKYLGMVRIQELTAHSAIARLVPTPYAPPVALHKDDEVASQILPGY